MFRYSVSLDQRVPPNHRLRRIRQQIAFSFAREADAVSCGVNGRVSEDPEAALKLMFPIFFDNLPSERELMPQAACRLDYPWFLGPPTMTRSPIQPGGET